jgi:hypothetical protein
VGIEEEFAVIPQFRYDRRTDGDVGDEVAVHNIEVDHFHAGPFDDGKLISQPGKVGAQYRGVYLDCSRLGQCGFGHKLYAAFYRVLPALFFVQDFEADEFFAFEEFQRRTAAR